LPLIRSTRGSPLATIIVPSFNSRITVGQCLGALVEQDCPEKFEIIVVDSSDDGTDKLIRGDFPGVRLIKLRDRTLPGRARNLGVEKARGEIVAFTDTDCIAPREWLRKHLKHHDEYDVVGGSIENQNPDSLVSWASYLLEFSGFTPSARRGPVDCLVTANISYKRNLFAGGGFPEDIWPGEDRIFHARLARDRQLFFDGSNPVGHVNRCRLNEMFDHQKRLGEAAASAWPQIDAHRSLLTIPELAAFTPPARIGLISARLLRDTPCLLLRAAPATPLILAGAGGWAWAFWRKRRLKG